MIATVGALAGDGLSVAITVGTGGFEAGDIITVTGTDLAGNTATLDFTLA
jgi:hypothetical protein